LKKNKIFNIFLNKGNDNILDGIDFLLSPGQSVDKRLLPDFAAMIKILNYYE